MWSPFKYFYRSTPAVMTGVTTAVIPTIPENEDVVTSVKDMKSEGKCPTCGCTCKSDPTVGVTKDKEVGSLWDTPKFKVDKFDPSTINGSTIDLILGKRAVGKTTLVKHLLTQGKFDKVHIFTNFMDNDYGTDAVHHNKYDISIIDHIIKKQKETKENRKPVMIVIEDDILSTYAVLRDEKLMWLIMNGRSADISMMLCMQYPIGISPVMRTNIDYVFLFRENTKSTVGKLYDHYAGMFPTRALFEQVFEKVTCDYSCMVINNVSRSYKLEDQVFWFQVPKCTEIEASLTLR
jgi:hypothetical protein